MQADFVKVSRATQKVEQAAFILTFSFNWNPGRPETFSGTFFGGVISG